MIDNFSSDCYMHVVHMNMYLSTQLQKHTPMHIYNSILSDGLEGAKSWKEGSWTCE